MSVIGRLAWRCVGAVGAISVADTAPPCRPLVFVKLFAIFAVVAIGWGAAQQRPARQRRPGARARRRGVLHLRAGAAVSHQGADRLRAARRSRPPRLLRADARRWSRSSTRSCACAARRRRRRRAAPSVRAITASFGNAVQIGIPLAAALYGEAGLALHLTLVSLHALILLDRPHGAGRARPRPRASGAATPAARGCCARWRRRCATRSSIRSSCRCSPAWPGTRRGCALPGFADEILATLGQAVVPLCLVLIGVSLAHYGVRGALRGAVALSLREARRPAAGGARVRALRARPRPACRWRSSS